MRRSYTMLTIALAIFVAFPAGAWAGAPTTETSAATETLLFQANAYGTRVSAGSRILGIPIGLVSLGGECSTEVGHREKSVLSVDSPPLVTTGAINTSADTGGNQASASAHTLDVDLLAGLITGEEVKAVSTTTKDATGLQVSAQGSLLVNAVVAGNAINGTPAPNTTVQLPGFGHVVLNEQFVEAKGNKARLTVNMIHVYITLANPLGIKVGTQIIVSHAETGLTVAPGPGVLDGRAYGVSVEAKVLSIKPIPLVVMPCLGTRRPLAKSIVSVNAPPAVVTGLLEVTAEGTITESLASGETTSTVHSVNLLNGLLTADLVVADAHASTDGTSFTFSDQGSMFLNLSVSDHPEITDSVAPNTRVSITGLGTLWLHRVIQTPNQIEVRMIELIVNVSNEFGLPIGTKIRIAVASASVH